MLNKWHNKTANETILLLGSDPTAGLSKKEAHERLRKDGKNIIYRVQKISILKCIKHILTDFISMLLLFCAVLSAIFGRPSVFALIFILYVINVSVVLFSYLKSHRILENMAEHTLPTAKVLRSGKLYIIRQEGLVRGDIIFVSAGDIIPCDARLIEADGLFVLEAGITNNEKAVQKDAGFVGVGNLPPEEQKNMIFASTIVTSGTGKAIVCNFGENTLVCEKKLNKTILTHDRLEVIAKLKKFCNNWSLISVILIFALTLTDVILRNDKSIFNIFTRHISLAASYMPEFFAIFAYIIIGCGIFNAIKRHKDINSGALIKNTSKIEDLKDINCLIIPKEALLYEDGMGVNKVYADGKFHDLQNVAFPTSADEVLRLALVSTGLYGAEKPQTVNSADSIFTAEEEAILAAAKHRALNTKSLETKYPLCDHVSCIRESARKIKPIRPFETALIKSGDGYTVAVRGDYKAVLECCDYYRENGTVSELTRMQKASIMIEADKLQNDNYKILAVATKKTELSNLDRINRCHERLTFEGFIAISTPLLSGVAENIARCRAAGIRIILFCDDVSEGNFALAKSLGIVETPEERVNINTLIDMDEDSIKNNLDKYSLYEGLNAAQKRQIHGWIKESGKYKTGVLGRELNDIGTLFEADAAFSVSTTFSSKNAGIVDIFKAPVFAKRAKGNLSGGSEAVKFMSDVIVSKSDKEGMGGFNSILGAIETSKHIYQNLLRMIRYLIISQLSRFFLMLFSVITGQQLLSAPQILYLGLFCDMAAVIIIAFERPSRHILMQKENTEKRLSIRSRYIINTLVFAFVFALVIIASIYIMRAFGVNLSENGKSSYVFVTYLLLSHLALIETIKERSIFLFDIRINNIYLFSTLSILVFALLCFIIPPLGSVFTVTKFAPAALIGTALCAVLYITVFEIIKIIERKKERQEK